MVSGGGSGTRIGCPFSIEGEFYRGLSKFLYYVGVVLVL